jgi:hypothetical protein
MFFSAVDAIGTIFILIFFYVYRYFSAISAKVLLQFPAVNNFLLPLYLSFFAEFSAIWQQCKTVTSSLLGQDARRWGTQSMQHNWTVAITHLNSVARMLPRVLYKEVEASSLVERSSNTTKSLER